MKNPDRVLGSRFRKVKKELSERLEDQIIHLDRHGPLNTWKPKSGLVMQGYTDPDFDTISGSSPVCRSRTLNSMITKGASKGWGMIIVDIKTPYLRQSVRERPSGKLHVRCPQDHPTIPGQICVLLKDSYGTVPGSLR